MRGGGFFLVQDRPGGATCGTILINPPPLLAPTMKQQTLRVRVEDEKKEALERRAKAKGLTVSELLRQLVDAEISSASALDDEQPIRIYGETRLVRMFLRIPAQLKEAVEQRAKQKGMTEARWVASLVQSNLMKIPVMSDKELRALMNLNRELAAIGRNVNQIAKQLNSAIDMIERSRVDLSGLARLYSDIELTRRVVRSLMLRSQQSWEAEVPGPDSIQE